MDILCDNQGNLQRYLKKTIRQQQHRELYRPSFSHELLGRCLIKRYAVQAKKSSVQYDLDNSLRAIEVIKRLFSPTDTAGYTKLIALYHVARVRHRGFSSREEVGGGEGGWEGRRLDDLKLRLQCMVRIYQNSS